jgi:hypothetical protein
MVLSVGGLIAGAQQTINFVKIAMKTNDKNLVMHKLNYLELTLKISKMRYHGEEIPIELLVKAHKLGSLAQIPDSELNSFLSKLYFE